MFGHTIKIFNHRQIWKEVMDDWKNFEKLKYEQDKVSCFVFIIFDTIHINSEVTSCFSCCIKLYFCCA